MWSKIKQIHPGWFIAGFFALLIITNVVFFAIAASTEVRLVDRHGNPRGQAPAAAAPAASAPAPAAPPTRPDATR